MSKKEIFKQYLNEVSKETEIDSELILSDNRTTEVVDARYILVKLLAEYGFYPQAIAMLTSRTSRSITAILTDFSQRKEQRRMFQINYETIRKRLGMNQETVRK